MTENKAAPTEHQVDSAQDVTIENLRDGAHHVVIPVGAKISATDTRTPALWIGPQRE